jgi:DNA polymerase/3'-5' exonuclease PolX
MILARALEIALKYQGILTPWCEPEMCKIAGSLRRQKPDVKDIELVCVPRTVHLIPFVTTVKQWIKLKGEPTGRYTQRMLYESIALDLFIPSKPDFIRQFVIRTGSADYSARVIATAWVKKGWVGTKDGLRRETQCLQKGKKWICQVPNPTLPPVWQSEQEFFDWLKVKFIPPQERNL